MCIDTFVQVSYRMGVDPVSFVLITIYCLVSKVLIATVKYWPENIISKWNSVCPTLRLDIRIFLVQTSKERTDIPVNSRIPSIIKLECRYNKWWNHPPPFQLGGTNNSRPRFTLILLLEQRVAPWTTCAMRFMVTIPYPLFHSSFESLEKSRVVERFDFKRVIATYE